MFLDFVNFFDIFFIFDFINFCSFYFWKGKNSIDNLCIYLFLKDDNMYVFKNLEIFVC